MKKLASILAALILTITLSASATAQTSASSTPANASSAASKPIELSDEQIKARLIADLKELRAVHEATKAERDAAIANLDAEKKISASTERSYKTAENQITILNRALEHQERAIALHERTIGLVEKQRDDYKREAKRSRKMALLATAALVAKLFGIF